MSCWQHYEVIEFVQDQLDPTCKNWSILSIFFFFSTDSNFYRADKDFAAKWLCPTKSKFATIYFFNLLFTTSFPKIARNLITQFVKCCFSITYFGQTRFASAVYQQSRRKRQLSCPVKDLVNTKMLLDYVWWIRLALLRTWLREKSRMYAFFTL